MTELFHPFPLYLFKHKVSNSLKIKEHFVPIITELVETKEESLSTPTGRILSHLTTSYYNSAVNNKIFSNSDLLLSCYREVFSGIAPARVTDCEVACTWFNYYTKNDYQEWHNHIIPNHINSFQSFNLSFVYFLSFNPDYHGSLTFKDPLEMVRTMSSDSEICGYNSTWIPEVEEGDMVVFPFYMEHCAKPFKKTVENAIPRITISGNVKLKF